MKSKTHMMVVLPGRNTKTLLGRQTKQQNHEIPGKMKSSCPVPLLAMAATGPIMTASIIASLMNQAYTVVYDVIINT
jgi:hypothetical protein